MRKVWAWANVLETPWFVDVVCVDGKPGLTGWLLVGLRYAVSERACFGVHRGDSSSVATDEVVLIERASLASSALLFSDSGSLHLIHHVAARRIGRKPCTTQ